MQVWLKKFTFFILIIWMKSLLPLNFLVTTAMLLIEVALNKTSRNIIHPCQDRIAMLLIEVALNKTSRNIIHPCHDRIAMLLIEVALNKTTRNITHPCHDRIAMLLIEVALNKTTRNIIHLHRKCISLDVQACIDDTFYVDESKLTQNFCQKVSIFLIWIVFKSCYSRFFVLFLRATIKEKKRDLKVSIFEGFPSSIVLCWWDFLKLWDIYICSAELFYSAEISVK